MVIESTEDSKQAGPATGNGQTRLAHLLRGRDGLELTLAGDGVPAPLLEINDLLRSGQQEQARSRFDETVWHVIQDCLVSDPGRTDIMYIAARFLWETDQPGPAERLLRRILALEIHPVVLSDLARLIQQDATRRSEARPYWRRAWELAPDNLDYLLEYAFCSWETGAGPESIELFERAVRLAPEHCGAELQLLWNINYLPEYDRAYIHTRAKQWAERHLGGIKTFSAHTNQVSPNRKLKVGIVSGDFMENSPLSFHEPALMTLNRETLALYAYSNVDAPDTGTDRWVALFDVFRDIHLMSDSDVAAQIRQDGIDILIAFGGQCHRHRLGVMALRPAPVQVDWGALCTLGLSQIDYRLTDAVLDPPDSQPYHVEELVYLSGGEVSYRPPPESPPVTGLPAQSNGFVTFGSFNSHLKISAQTLDMWARILRRMPQARMKLKFLGGQDVGVCERLRQRFESHGIHRQRIRIQGRTDYDDHLDCLGQVDLLLDTYPFNGFRTTLEGLWMGVPAVTLSGTTFVSRMGLAIMKQLNLDAAFVAQRPDSYIDRACAYAGQIDELAQVRRGLRALLLSSSICDPARYAGSLERAFRTMWHRWCQQQHTRQDQAC